MAKPASPKPAPPARNPSMLLRILQARARLFFSVLLGIAVATVLPPQWPIVNRALVGWDVGVTAYIVAIYWLMGRADIGRMRRQAAIEDEGQFTILTLTVAAALASIGAIVVELGGAKEHHPSATALLLAIVTILLSWAFIHTIFALHYAHEYYGEGRDRKEGGLQFPADNKPDYWDFVYFSFVIGMTFQVSDVAVTSKLIRRLVVVHGIVSFVFNVALVALTVNIAANAI